MEKYLIGNNKTDGEKNYVHEDISDVKKSKTDGVTE